MFPLRLLGLTLLAVPALAQADGAPVAQNDTYTTSLGNNLSQDAPGVLENDTDPDGDTLTAQLVSSAGTTGVLRLFTDGSFEYEPATLGQDVFTYQAHDATQGSNVATITFDVTPGTGVTQFTDEASFQTNLVLAGYERVLESFEDEATWAASRTNPTPSITSQGVTWSSNWAVNGIRTGPGPGYGGHYGFFSIPHGNYLAGPQCLQPGACTDGWRGTSTQQLFAIGGWVSGFYGSKIQVVLDDDPARAYDLGLLATGQQFFGLVDSSGFHTFEFRELEGTSGDAKYIFGDHFTFARAGSGGPLVYGCGPNPIGSMRVLSGTPSLGDTLTLGIDNPLGTQNAGSIPVLALAFGALPNFPCGIAINGWGMLYDYGGAPGELLINALPPDPFQYLVGAPWSGPGTPAPIPVPIPNDPGLVGLVGHAQGVLIDPSQNPAFGARFGLTEGIELTIVP